jgi:hypothetical protein
MATRLQSCSVQYNNPCAASAETLLFLDCPLATSPWDQTPTPSGICPIRWLPANGNPQPPSEFGPALFVVIDANIRPARSAGNQTLIDAQ